MPRLDPTPLRWAEEAEARRISERAALVRHDSEHFPQILQVSAEQQKAAPLFFVARVLSWFFTAIPEYPADRERKWHDGPM